MTSVLEHDWLKNITIKKNRRNFEMNKFEVAELEVITFEDDVIAASGYHCEGDVCMCDGQYFCHGDN